MVDNVILTQDALTDLEAIAVFTEETFGPRQAERYRDALGRTLLLLGAFPHMGAEVDRVLTGSRRHVHGSHAIYYRIDGDVVRVLRLLGPGQDPMREFGGESET